MLPLQCERSEPAKGDEEVASERTKRRLASRTRGGRALKPQTQGAGLT